MKKDCLLIVFVKNSELGKVKTRLAKSVGDKKALEIYKELLQITEQSASGATCNKQVWYSEYIDDNDQFSSLIYDKFVQSGEDLGLRMKKAVAGGFDEGYDKVIIIGSDCPDLTSESISEAFNELESFDAVIGPSKDGGYYLLGLRKFTPQIFQGIDWSTSNVLSQTETILNNLEMTYSTLKTLNDIDTEEDLEASTLYYTDV